mmetsp:Transcript_19854/g.60228  ORF Transcript_19854/g.60228 Transcript_19854/m.60228 type:complete len:246 (-) Transcript_19854:1312-2049(-)
MRLLLGSSARALLVRRRKVRAPISGPRRTRKLRTLGRRPLMLSSRTLMTERVMEKSVLEATTRLLAVVGRGVSGPAVAAKHPRPLAPAQVEKTAPLLQLQHAIHGCRASASVGKQRRQRSEARAGAGHGQLRERFWRGGNRPSWRGWKNLADNHLRRSWCGSRRRFASAAAGLEGRAGQAERSWCLLFNPWRLNLWRRTSTALRTLAGLRRQCNMPSRPSCVGGGSLETLNSVCSPLRASRFLSS